MGDIVYWTIGGFWILICFALGLYIRSNGAAEIKLKIGFAAIFISYLFGIGILVAALYM